MIVITGVRSGSKEQPVIINYDGDNGRPYKPGKSMRRVLVAMWGVDGSQYVGKRLILYCDTKVQFGGDEVGGIRISHASGISETLSIALTVRRAKKEMFKVLPLPETEDLIKQGEAMAKKGSAALASWFADLPAVGGIKKDFWATHGEKLKALAAQQTQS